LSSTPLSRRGFLHAAAGVAGAALLGGCGSDEPSGQAPTPQAADGFPVTVPHKFGSTTVEQAPQRVLSLAYTDHEPLLALGIIPVGVIGFNAGWPEGVGPWATPHLKGQKLELFQHELNYEKVAAARPDLILTISFDGLKEPHDKLTQIAPTVAPPAGFVPYGVPWQQSTELIAKAVGRTEDGKKLVADTEATLAKAAAEHPQFKGKTVTVAYDNQGQLGAYTKQDGRPRFFSTLGFSNNPEVDALQKTNFYVDISTEQVQKLEADLVVFIGTTDTTRDKVLRDNPALATLPAVKQNRFVVVEDYDVVTALSASSVLSAPYALDHLLPQLTEAVPT
jgi:iron-siderophore transport system substrate-binding protein